MSKWLISPWAAAVMGVTLTAATALAQNEPARPRTAPAEQPAARAGAQVMQPMDTILANWLIVENEGEIALAQLGQQRAQETEVKQFSQRMIKDHQEFLAKLQRFAGAQQPRGAVNPDQGRREADNRRDAPERGDTATRKEDQAPAREAGQTAPATARPAQPAGQKVAQRQPGDMGQRIIGLKRELGQQCQQTARRELEEKRGAEFDQCYMFQQVAMHLHAVDTMKVFQGHASGELRQVLSEGVKTAEEHLEHAKHLAKKLDDGAATARREKTTESKK
jgi:predicted outer membrane protein